MKHPIPEHLIKAIEDDFNTKVDALRNELLYEAGKAHKKYSHDFAISISKSLNSISNDVEVARRIFNHYLATGDVVFPD